MSDLTFVIPVGPAHTHVYHEAAEAVEAQTVKCDYIVQQDTDGKGSGWARNKGLERVTSEYVAFLDADDTIAPNFAELCLDILNHYAASGKTDPRYIYTDWLGASNAAHKAPEPCEAWTNQTFHLVTTVLPTDRVRLIGGFDEVMPGVEDADFYVRLRLSGVCGLHVNAPLVHYREGGQRSLTARRSGQEELVKQYMTQRYGGIPMAGCCGDPTPGPVMPDGEPPEGFVLVQAQWGGNMPKRGLATGTIYPRTSHPKYLYVDPRDAAQSPNLFKRVTTPMQAANGIILQPQYQGGETPWQKTAEAIFGGGQPPQPPSQPVEYRPNVAGRSKAAVLQKAQEPTWTKVAGDLE